MGHIPEDENFDEFMNASAEEWSEPEKPEEPEAVPESPPEPTDRWGSPIPDPDGSEDVERWGSEPQAPAAAPKPATPVKKTGSKWWIFAIVAVVLLCLCACIVLFGLPLLGVSIFESNLITY